MNNSGLSRARLGRMHDVMAGYVERGEVPGIVTLVSRRGEVHVDAIGMQAVGDSDPMRRDTIFRISSMTKPITAAATMILVEECKVRLDEPVDRLLPELAGRKVLKRLDGSLQDTVPANRPITVRDLLTFRMGFGQMMLDQGKHGNERLLSRPSVETMTTDQLTPEQKAASGIVSGYFDSHGWGFGVSMVTRRDDVAAVPGRFGWDGGLGTSWYSDPREDMVTILMTQRAWASPSPPDVCLDFWTSAYQAIDD
jgi:CubicO group peptidase (beta-lactamase class C family)